MENVGPQRAGRRTRIICRRLFYWPSVADAALGGLIVITGVIALSPLAAIEAAGETIRDRRRRRALSAAVRANYGEVWATHLGRRGEIYIRGAHDP